MSVVALAVIAPFFFKGDASGHDFEFHVASWMEVARQWYEGVFYPRWAALANFGYGEPRFIFYPPASWMLGAGLSLVLPWRAVPAAYYFVTLLLAGCAMYRLGREWLDPPNAIGAGALFAANPYHLLVVYWRSDFAELLASAVFPLLLLSLLQLGREPRRFLKLPAVVAFIWLANAPAGVIASYSAALMLIVIARSRRSIQPLVYGAASIVLGLAVAAFYIVPAAFEQPWVSIAQVLSSGLRPQENFLFTVTSDPEHTLFNFIASGVAVGMLAALGIAVSFARSIRERSPLLWWMLTSLSLACILLMAPVSSVLWTYLPKLRFVQFPWRWLFPLSVPMVAFVTSALLRARTRVRIAFWILSFTALGVCGWLLAAGADWDTDDVNDLREAIIEQATGYVGTDEYAPRDADPYDVDKRAPRVAEVVSREERRTLDAPAITIERWYSELKAFTVTMDRPATLILRLLNYPAWRVQRDGQTVEARSSEGTGQVLISVPAGTSHVRVDFIRTSDRTVGGCISLVALAAWVLLFFRYTALKKT